MLIDILEDLGKLGCIAFAMLVLLFIAHLITGGV